MKAQHTLYGLKIIIMPLDFEPKFKLRKDMLIADETRNDFDKYLLDTFGLQDITLLKPGEMWKTTSAIYMRTDDFNKIKAALACPNNIFL